MPLAFLFNIGGPEMIVILVVGLLIFGRQLPDVGRKVGRTVAQLRQGMQEFQRQWQEDEDLGEASRSVRELGNELRGVRKDAGDGVGGDGLRGLGREALGPDAAQAVGSVSRGVQAVRDPGAAMKRLVEEGTAVPDENAPADSADGADGASR